MIKRIKLTQGKFALVDDEDFEWLNQWKWCAACSKDHWNACRGQGVLMHRVIMNAPKGLQVDHKNHNGLDNQRYNLRLATQSQNNWNRRVLPKGKSKYKGVFPSCLKSRPWAASIKLNNKSTFLGYFFAEKEAGLAYDEKALELFGEFACINFPEDK
ncbi:hypothetical protein LCGC14_0376260 [marine sediment metagenome]|uniref:AP2/ERF domain-containing protein n=1 Tax=marine sediment metagenome TaxID=412755 RepID=A0A0F9WCK2_9ZZZZ